MKTKSEVACWVDDAGDLMADVYPWGSFRLRRATADERRRSLAAGDTGHITAEVSPRIMARLAKLTESEER